MKFREVRRGVELTDGRSLLARACIRTGCVIAAAVGCGVPLYVMPSNPAVRSAFAACFGAFCIYVALGGVLLDVWWLRQSKKMDPIRFSEQKSAWATSWQPWVLTVIPTLAIWGRVLTFNIHDLYVLCCVTPARSGRSPTARRSRQALHHQNQSNHVLPQISCQSECAATHESEGVGSLHPEGMASCSPGLDRRRG